MIYVISDIHGNKKAWESIKKQINLTEDDTLYILGDVVDRGQDGIGILLEIINSRNMLMIPGNHEYMMMRALGVKYKYGSLGFDSGDEMELWYRNGGQVTHEKYKTLDKTEQEKVKEYLRNLPLNREVFINGTDHVLVHAQSQDIYFLMEYSTVSETTFCVWDREYILQVAPILPQDMKIIFGHTPTINFPSYLNENEEISEYMTIFKYKGVVGVDCGAGFEDIPLRRGGRLACLRLDDKKAFYSKY